MELFFPCENGWDSQGLHDGYSVDIGCYGKANCDIYAVADGKVEFEGYYSQVFKVNGKLKTYYPIGVMIRHTQFSDEYDYISIYWHLASTCVDKGNEVKAGQKIGIKGNTGYSFGAHLHFQVLKLKKGEEIPNEHYPYKSAPWINKKIGIDPIPLFRLHDGQAWKYSGNWYQDIKKDSGLDKLIVERDYYQHQVQVTADNLRARKTANETGEIIDYIPMGLFNVYEVTKDDKYTWYRVGTDVWIAFDEQWAIDYPVKKVDEYKKLYEEEVKKYDELFNKYSQLTSDYSNLQASYENINTKLDKVREIVQ